MPHGDQVAGDAVKPDRVALRRETGVRTFADLPLERADGLEKTFYDARSTLPSIRPVLVLAEGVPADEVRAEAEGLIAEGRDVLVGELSADPDGSLESLRRRTEDALVLARNLSHRCAGKTVEVHAVGSAVPPAALMMAVERPYFSVLVARAAPPPRPGWPTWEEMAK